jgi:hypothetical protein
MKFVSAILFSSLTLIAAEPQVKAPLEIPAGAVERMPRWFYYTDSQGKQWIYIRTAFGVSRTEDRSTGVGAATSPAIKAVADGEIVKFERPSPFGMHRWQKNRQDLDEKEKAALAQAQNVASKQDN